MNIKVGQRYNFKFITTPQYSFVGEVISIDDQNPSRAKLIALSVSHGSHFWVGEVFNSEDLSRSEYTYLEGQDKPND